MKNFSRKHKSKSLITDLGFQLPAKNLSLFSSPLNPWSDMENLFLILLLSLLTGESNSSSDYGVHFLSGMLRHFRAFDNGKSMLIITKRRTKSVQNPESNNDLNLSREGSLALLQPRKVVAGKQRTKLWCLFASCQICGVWLAVLHKGSFTLLQPRKKVAGKPLDQTYQLHDNNRKLKGACILHKWKKVLVKPLLPICSCLYTTKNAWKMGISLLEMIFFISGHIHIGLCLFLAQVCGGRPGLGGMFAAPSSTNYIT